MATNQKAVESYSPSSIRINPGLKEAITRRAAAANRTFSQHVVHLLEEHVRSTPEPKPSPFERKRSR